MIKFLSQIVLTVALGFVAHYYLPWWWVLVPAAGLTGLLFFYKNSAGSFLAGFLAGLLVWGGYAMYLDTENQGLLTSKMGELFHVSGGYLACLAGLTGGILGGFGAMTGTLLRKLFHKTPGEASVA